MKMKKNMLISVVAVFTGIVLVILLCINNTRGHNKYSFVGEILELHERSIFVLVNEKEEEAKSSDKVVVSLGDKIGYITNKFRVGDSIRIYYDGVMLESYPAQIINVNKIEIVEN